MPPDANSFTLRARLVVPVEGPPIDGGYVTIAGERIAAVGRLPPDGPMHDLGDVALLPGLVNAHTHLEYSDLKAPLGRPGMALPDWIRLVVSHKRRGGTNAGAIEAGLRESLHAGVTTLGEIASPGWPTAPFAGWPGQATVFQELIGLRGDAADERMALAGRHLAAAVAAAWRGGLSPHAPYTVHRELLSRVVDLAAGHSDPPPIAMHLAESREELRLLHDGDGPFRDLLEELGAWDAAAIPAVARPIDYLRVLARAPRSLIIHGNYLDEEEIALVAAHADRMTVVYCPRTHEWFGHAEHPLPRLLAAGASVAVGTDGRCSNPDLDLWEELRCIARRFPQIDADKVLAMGTIDAARALGLADDVGSLRPGKWADLVAVSGSARALRSVENLLAEPALKVRAVYCRGRCVIAGNS